MTTPDQPTEILARIYRFVWLAVVVLLLGAGITHGVGSFAGITADTGSSITSLCVQIYFLLVPMAIFVFAAWMTLRKDWKLASTGYILTAIWIGAKLLG